MKAATILDDGLTLTADISIHAAREGGDATVASAFADAFCISIHAAREGGDPCALFRTAFIYISIHAAREGGDVDAVNANHGDIISIHAAREGGDSIVSPNDKTPFLFQSTPPVKAATLHLP